MTTFKDTALYAFLFGVVYLFVHFIFGTSFFQNNLPWTLPLLILPMVFYFVVLNKLKGRKRVAEYIKSDLAALGYMILKERPLTFAESYEYAEVKTGIFVNNLSISDTRYRSVFKRWLLVKNDKEHYFELVITVRQTWGNKFQYRIENTSRVRDIFDTNNNTIIN